MSLTAAKSPIKARKDTQTLCLKISRVLGGVVVLEALTVMVGWLWDMPLVRNPFPGTVDMKFNTALAFLMLGSALLLVPHESEAAWRRGAKDVLAAMVIVFGGLTLTEYVFRFDSGFSQFFVQEGKGALYTVHLGRPAPITALNFFLLGIAVIQNNSKNQGWQSIPILAGAGTLLALFGYVYGNPHFYTIVPSATGIAISTSLLFLALTIGILATNVDHPVMAILTHPGTGGILARRLLPMAIILPLLVDFLSDFGVGRIYDVGSKDVVRALLTAIILTYVCLITARVLMKVDDSRQQAEAHLARESARYQFLLRTASDGVHILDEDGNLIEASDSFWRMLGYTQEQAASLNVLDWDNEVNRDQQGKITNR